MNCQNLKLKYEELLTLQADFQAANAEFQKMKPSTVAERREVSDELRRKQIVIEKFIKDNFEALLFVSVEKARSIMDKNLEAGKTHCFGPVEIEKAFGIKLNKQDTPKIPFSKQELQRANEMGKFLILRANIDDQGSWLTMKNLADMMLRRGYCSELDKDGNEKGKITYEEYGAEDFWLNDPIELRWALVDKEVLPNSTDKDYLEQTALLREHVMEIYKNQTIPPKYAEAIKEFDEYVKSRFNGMTRNEINALTSGVRCEKYAEELSELMINDLTRKTPNEELYDELMYMQINNERLNEHTANWTRCLRSDYRFVRAYSFDAKGLDLSTAFIPNSHDDNLVVFASLS